MTRNEAKEQKARYFEYCQKESEAMKIGDYRSALYWSKKAAELSLDY